MSNHSPIHISSDSGYQDLGGSSDEVNVLLLSDDGEMQIDNTTDHPRVDFDENEDEIESIRRGDNFQIIEPDHIEGVTITTRPGGSKMIINASKNRTVGGIIYSTPFRDRDREKIRKNVLTKQKKPISVYSIPKLRPIDERIDRNKGYSCYVRGPYITFRRSDAKFPPFREHVVNIKERPILDDGTVNFYWKLPEDHQSPTQRSCGL